MKRAIQLAVAAAFLALFAGNVKADPVLLSYSLTGPGNLTASFDLPELPVITPDNSLLGFGFLASPTNIVVDGSSVTEQILFYSGTPVLDGMSIPGPAGGLGGIIFPVLSGPQLYSGSEATPTMLTGVFTLTDFFSQEGTYKLTVSPVVTTPESSTLILFGTGLIALALMRKRRVATANFTA